MAGLFQPMGQIWANPTVFRVCNLLWLCNELFKLAEKKIKINKESVKCKLGLHCKLLNMKTCILRCCIKAILHLQNYIEL